MDKALNGGLTQFLEGHRQTILTLKGGEKRERWVEL